MANDDDVMDEDSETDEFITASENGVEDEDSEEDEFAKQIREPEEIEWGRHGKWGRSKWIREQMGQQVNEEEDEDSEEDELWNTDDMMRIQIGDGGAEYRRELRQLSSREKQTDSAETIAKRRLYAYQQEQRVRVIALGRYWRRLALQTDERELELETDAHATEWDETETFDAGRHSMKSCDEEEHEECSGVAAAAAPPDEMTEAEPEVEAEPEPAPVSRREQLAVMNAEIAQLERLMETRPAQYLLNAQTIHVCDRSVLIGEQCCICLEEISEDLAKTQCGHQYHLSTQTGV